MKFNRILATVSAVALTTAAAVSGAKADNVLFDLTALPLPELNAAPASASVVAVSQFDVNVLLQATTDGVLKGIPVIAGPQDFGGGTDSVTVDLNETYAEAIGNTSIASVDLITATGAGLTSAATAATLQGNLVTTTGTVESTVSASSTRAFVEDLGAGSSIVVDENTIRADSTANLATTQVIGALNPALSSTELGASTATAAGMESGATVLAATMQLTIDLDTASALVTSSRIGALAIVDTEAAIEGIPLSVSDNLASAIFTGNQSTNLVDIQSAIVTFNGSAGAANFQTASGAAGFGAIVGDDPATADPAIETVVIEVGDSANLTTIADLDGSSVAFEGNDILAATTANTSRNTVRLADDISIAGTAATGGQVNGAGGGVSIINADLFVQNLQTSTVVAGAATGDDDDGQSMLNVLTEDVYGSTIAANGNGIATSATGNNAINAIDVGDSATFEAFVGINTVQLDSALQVAFGFGYLTVDVAGDIDTLGAAAGEVISSAITVDGNSFSADAMANSQSSALDLTGGTITGPGGVTGIASDRSAGNSSVAADFSVYNAQLVDGQDTIGVASAQASLQTTVNVNVIETGGLAGSELVDSSLSVSSNDLGALAIGNLSTEASISVDATNFAGTIGVINDQSVLNLTQLTASVEDIDGDGLVEVEVNPETLNNSAINVDNNSVSARVWGNLADSSTNAISVTGVTVDGSTVPSMSPLTTVNRTSDTVSITNSTADFMLVNDQSVEDLEDAVVTASNTPGDFVYVELGGDTADSVITDIQATTNDNASLTSATLNQSTSRIGVAATTLDASMALTNVQTIADEDNDNLSAGIDVDVDDNDIEIHLEAGTQAMSDVSAQINDNTITASGRANMASNAITLSAQTMIVSEVATSGTEESVALGDNTAARGQVTLVNDQFIDAMNGINVLLEDSDIYIQADASIDTSLVDSDFQVEGNATLALAAGNDAANGINLNVGTFDLSNAEVGGGALNGPIASLASNQSGIDANASISAEVLELRNAIEALGLEDVVDGVSMSVDENSIRALARSNNVSNVLTVTGTTFDNGATGSTPSASVIGTVGGDITLDQTSFALGSRQINDYVVGSSVTDADMFIEIYDADTIDDTALSVSGNALVSEARANDGINTLTTNFTTNGAQSFVANVQLGTESDAQINAELTGVDVYIDAEDGVTMTASSLAVDTNAIAALSSANRATNTLGANGTNIVSGSGVGPTTIVETGNGPDVQLITDFGLVNVQGAIETDSDADTETYAFVEAVTIDASVTEAISGSVSVDNNLVLGQAIENSATNTLALVASANVGQVGDTPSAILVSQQFVSDDNTVETDVLDVQIGALENEIEDVSAAGSVAVTVDGNDVMGQAIAGTATNTLRVTAGAEILGNGATPSATLGDVVDDPVTLNADYTLLNIQLGSASNGGDLDIDTEVDTVLIGATINSDMVNDSLSIDNNMVAAEADGFLSSNRIALTAGSSSDATAQLANIQGIGIDEDMDIEADSSNVDIIGTLTGSGLDNSSLTVSGNTVTGDASGNTALNALTTTAAATLQESSGAGSVIDLAAASQISVTGSDYSVLNSQSVDGSVINGGIDLVNIGADDLSGANGVNDSNVEVNGNTVLASASGNDATSALVLNTGTFQHPSASVASLQANSDATISADISSVNVGIGLGGGLISGPSSNSSLTVRGNVVGASAVGNSATSSISGN
ncbi:hypothetical protein [Iodidimonas sp. SYSU 1G8]|uniref:beta strand repeat-containing protein n=1 Tax=Iodidimonas sp. SYSU 1G8 TaxID=3133967 RepID=UPI0031FEE689